MTVCNTEKRKKYKNEWRTTILNFTIPIFVLHQKRISCLTRDSPYCNSLIPATDMSSFYEDSFIAFYYTIQHSVLNTPLMYNIHIACFQN